MSDILDCALTRWSPGIGDPTLMGWLTVAVYAVACAMALQVLARADFSLPHGRRERAFWAVAALALAALAVNKQLDLQSFLTAAGRCVAQAQGWYEERRHVQREFILILIAVTAAGLLLAFVLLRGTYRRTGLALVGLGFVSGFVLVRAVGFHHFDALINTRIAHLRMNWVLELPGPLLFCLAAALRLRMTPALSR